MDRRNFTSVSEFLLIGLSDVPELQLLFFIVFLMIYIITLLGNLSIICSYILSTILHTPMYFFLAHFSFLDLCYISVNVPMMLVNFLAERKTVSFYGCVVQVYTFGLCGGTECYVLAAMAYDRYVAICHPLLYNVIMRRTVCIWLIIGSYLIGSTNSLIHTVITFTLPYCGPYMINHIFCDIPPILQLACADTRINQIVILVTSICVVVVSFMLIVISYIYIVAAVISLYSTSGRKKAFSTCTSHFIVVTIFYGSVMFMYLKPESNASNQDRLVAVMYTVIVPLLNPFIYSLRNNDMKRALLKIYNKLALPK
ncbi:olfactory receptor 5A2-like [Dendropsophus ebraccatus]|uniref:olfactory receptor 5A2-like n=1 Tax=Dendropsophus ebraccatus TaxID=150705 RepID=UPI0038314057